MSYSSGRYLWWCDFRGSIITLVSKIFSKLRSFSVLRCDDASLTLATSMFNFHSIILMQKTKTKNQCYEPFGGSLEISYLFIFACCCKIVAVARKGNGCNSIIMANQCVNWTSLKQIQNFCRPIIAAGDHNISAGMECNRIDRLQMDIVQLNQFGGSPIENFNLATAECNCNQWTVWMPCHIVTYTMKLHNQIYDRAMNLWFRFSMAAYHAHCRVRQMFVHNRRYSHQTISMYDLLSTMQSFCHSVNTVHNLHDSCAPKTIVKIASFRCSTIWRLCLRLRSPIFDLLDEIPHCGRRTMLEMCTMYREWLVPTPEMNACVRWVSE